MIAEIRSSSLDMQSVGGAFRDWISAPVGTPIPAEITMEEWSRWGAYLAAARTVIDWKSVDWIMYAERSWPETYHQFAEATGLSPEYMRKLAWVGSAFSGIRAKHDIDDIPIAICSEFATSDLDEKHKMALIEDYRRGGYTRSEWRLYVRHYKYNVIHGVSPKALQTAQEQESDAEPEQDLDYKPEPPGMFKDIPAPEMLSVRIRRDAYNALFRFMDRNGITDISEGILEACGYE